MIVYHILVTRQFGTFAMPQSTDNLIHKSRLPLITILILDLSIHSRSEDLSSDGVTVNLEWSLLNSQIYYQQLLRNVSVNADPQLSNVVFTGSMSVQFVLSYQGRIQDFKKGGSKHYMRAQNFGHAHKRINHAP